VLAPYFDYRRPPMIMAIFHAAFDESGKADREAVVFAGLIAPPGPWLNLQKEWLALLEPLGLRYWRTTDAAQFSGPFRRFRDRKQDIEKLALKLADAVCANVEGGTAHTITMQEYRRLPQERRQQLKNPFYAAFDAGLMGLATGPHVTATDTVVLVYDDAEEYASECLAAYRRFKKIRAQVAERVIGLCFHDDKYTPSLQAADLFAFVHRRKAESILTGVWADVMARFDETFSEHSASDIKV
jgi:hypothetical protein